MFNGFKRLFRKGSCERIISYDGRTLTVEALDIPAAPFSLGSINTDVEKIREASETAAILDQYQYQMCKICEGLGHEDEEWRKYNKLRIASINLITTFRLGLELYKKDPEHNRDRLDDILRRLESLHEIDDRVLPNFGDIKLKTEKGELVAKGQVQPVRAQEVSLAIHVAEMQEDEVDRLVEEIKS